MDSSCDERRDAAIRSSVPGFVKRKRPMIDENGATRARVFRRARSQTTLAVAAAAAAVVVVLRLKPASRSLARNLIYDVYHQLKGRASHRERWVHYFL